MPARGNRRRNRRNHRGDRSAAGRNAVASGPHVIELRNLNEVTEVYVRQLLEKLAGPLLESVRRIEPMDAAVRVHFPDGKMAEKAFQMLKKRCQKGGRVLEVSLVGQAPNAAAAGTGQRDNKTKQCPAPYHFVPVEPKVSIVESPVLHDSINLEDLWTGRLQCEMTALTPLLAANYQYDFASNDPQTPGAPAPLVQAFKQLVARRMKNRKLNDVEVAPDKKIIEPLMLPARDPNVPGPVLIGPGQLKGMLRQSWAALLSAPMERVWERTFSYRPNVRLNPKSDNLLKTCVGVVVEVLETGDLKVVELGSLADLVYVDSSACESLFKAMGITEEQCKQLAQQLAASANANEFWKKLEQLRAPQQVDGCRMDTERGRTKLVCQRSGGRPAIIRDSHYLYLLRYRTGLDGQGIFNQAFHGDSKRNGYPWVLARLSRRLRTVTISRKLVEAWCETLDHLANEEHGHLRDHPNIGDRKAAAIKAIRAMRKEHWRPGHVVFYETTASGNQVVTLGHNFRYRFRYRDSIHTTGEKQDQAGHLNNYALTLRDILCPRPLEQRSDEDGRPRGLSAARLLFGYVGSSNGQYSASEPLTFGIGLKPNGRERDFQQLAGRISINMAVEQGDEKTRELRPADQRFLNGNHQFLVPLRPLGAPKPSAVEHYLTQDRIARRKDAGILCTYGDTADDPATGNLRGRKFYLHQPEAARKPQLYELTGPQCPDWESGNTCHILGNQSAIARFVSRPGTKFRFSVRFYNLRSWELGGLIFCLSPTARLVELLGRALPSNAGEKLQHWLANAKTRGWLDEKQFGPLLAHKLGHGRPLGLGSALIEIDRLCRLVVQPADGDRTASCQERSVEPLQDAVEALVQDFAKQMEAKLGGQLTHWVEHVLIPWLEVHRFAGRRQYDYPRGKNNAIFEYHSRLRADHAGGRKNKNANHRQQPGLPKLKSFD